MVVDEPVQDVADPPGLNEAEMNGMDLLVGGLHEQPIAKASRAREERRNKVLAVKSIYFYSYNRYFMVYCFLIY